MDAGRMSVVSGLPLARIRRALRRDADVDARLAELRDGQREMWKVALRTWRRMDVILMLDLERRYRSLADPAFRAPLRTDHVDDRVAILELLERTGAPNRTFIDIGCGRSGGHSLLLASQLGWRGLFVDMSHEAVERLRQTLHPYPNVEVRQCVVTPDNVDGLVSEVGDEIDFLSIDIDSYDFWVWWKIGARPRVVSIEYNAAFGLERPVTVPYGSISSNTPKGYSGASLTALAVLAKEKGYVLVGCDFEGTNAFFCRDDLGVEGTSPAQAWRPGASRSGPEGGVRSAAKVMDKIRALNLPLVEVGAQMVAQPPSLH
jgi:hypothetical protein